LAALGYEYIEPQGAFYVWMRALEPDAVAFAEAAKSHELLLVPSDSFGVSGWVRIGYCVSPETITGSLAAFAALAAQYR
ncbi:MAG: aminotransferase class I/II-fold pyridoxal phosphate-dependent enzyme, partial [Raoultibacter sp.]